MELRFLLDGMLGKLSSWLRILGYDTIYASELNDAELLRTANEESRILVTRDKDLHRRAIMNNVKSQFLENTCLSDWLLVLHRNYGISMDLQEANPRCTICNHPLDRAGSDTNLKTVPTSVRERTREFRHCGACGKTYWQGTHWKNIRSFLETIIRLERVKLEIV